MYGKSYESKFTGSMIGAGFHVFAVWDYVITNARCGTIELNPKLLAFTLDGAKPDSEDQVMSAIEYLCRPDPRSRSKDADGRRLIKEGEYQYRIVNWAKYDAIKTEADRREYNRIKQAEYRAKKRTDSEQKAYDKEYRKRRKHDAACEGAKTAIQDGLVDLHGK